VLQLPEERPRLVSLVDHDPILPAPPDLELDAGRCDPMGLAQRAPGLIGESLLSRQAADLAHGRGSQLRRHLREPTDEVRDRVHGNGARKQMRVPGDEEQRLLSAHAASECVDAGTIDPNPGKSVRDDAGHPRQVVDLAAVAERLQVEPATHPVRVDDREAADSGQVAPVPGIRETRASAPMRRDDEWQGRVVTGVVPPREEHPGLADLSVVRSVGDLQELDSRRGRVRAGRAPDRGDDGIREHHHHDQESEESRSGAVRGTVSGGVHGPTVRPVANGSLTRR
jgi:hypothetical protein